MWILSCGRHAWRSGLPWSLLLFIGCDARCSRTEYDEAIADLQPAPGPELKDAVAYNERGLAWVEKQEYDKAIADYTEAIRLDPKFAMAYFNRGDVWFAKKEYDKAIADYNEAIRLDPRFARAYINRGLVWAASRSTTRRSPTSTRPSGSTQGRKRLLQPRHRLAQQEGARQGDRRLHRGHPLDPKFAGSLRQPRRRLAEKQEYDKAIADYTEAIRLDPKYAMRLQQPRQRLDRQEGVRQGDRRLHRGDPTRSQVRRGLRTIAATPGKTSRSTTRRSPTTPRPSGSTRHTDAGLPQPRHRLARQEGIRQGDRRLHRGHPARPQVRARLQQPRHRLVRQEGVRQGDRRLRRGHPARPQVRRGLQQPRHRLARQEGVRQGDRRLLTRPSDSTPRYAIAYNNRGIAWFGEEGVRQGDRRLHRGHPARPQVRHRLLQPRHRLE